MDDLDFKYQGVERRLIPERCIEHSDRLHVLEIAVTGNGSDDIKVREASLQWQVRLLVERQKPIYNFVKGWNTFLWICAPICVTGAVAAIFQVFKHMIHTGWKP